VKPIWAIGHPKRGYKQSLMKCPQCGRLVYELVRTKEGDLCNKCIREKQKLSERVDKEFVNSVIKEVNELASKYLDRRYKGWPLPTL